MSLTTIERIADAVLFEGYVLYPYRASAPKNTLRWQVGLLTPREFGEAVRSDPWQLQAECVAELTGAATLTARLRALHVQSRTVERRDGGPLPHWTPVDRVTVDDALLLAWEEAVPIELTCTLRLDDSPAAAVETWIVPPFMESEEVYSRGALAARIGRRRESLLGSVEISAEPCDGLTKIRLRLENVTPCRRRTLADRPAAVQQSFAAAHAILSIDGGHFVSLLDPPVRAQRAVAGCVNVHAFPVLAGAPEHRTHMLVSPVLLYDYPAVAPESTGDLCDATEIDELLTLRVRTLTESEKREARATDPRAAAIVDRCDAAGRDALLRLHGARRRVSEGEGLDAWADFLNPPGAPAPEADALEVDGRRLRRGSRVRLQPGRWVDSLDVCLHDRLATVTAIYRTLEEEPYVAVVLDDDPFGPNGEPYRRRLFFRPAELAPIDLEQTR